MSKTKKQKIESLKADISHLEAKNKRLVEFGTDWNVPGNEDDPFSSRSLYGRNKRQIEFFQRLLAELS
jgi:hypothetical protein